MTQRNMNVIIRIAAVTAAMTGFAGSAHAQNTSGPLNVSTEVSATCSSPDPDGSLQPELDPADPFSDQPFSSDVYVTVVCTGGVYVESVTFDGGSNEDAGALTGRAMKNSDAGACLSYRLRGYIGSSFEEIGIDTPVNTREGDRTDDFTLISAINGGAIASGGTDCDDDSVDPADMSTGTYSDVVTMTLNLAPGDS